MLSGDVYMASPHELTVYENNAKQHDDTQIEQIIESIKEFGFNDPIGIDENGVVIEGHGRLLAALRMGLQEVPVFRIGGLSEEQKNAYRIVHNQLTNNTGFDDDILQNEISKITDIDMSRFSFLDDESFFDPEKEYKPAEKGEIVVAVAEEYAEDLRQWLDLNLIDYGERHVRG